MTPTELRSFADTLEAQAKALRALADDLERPAFRLAPLGAPKAKPAPKPETETERRSRDLFAEVAATWVEEYRTRWRIEYVIRGSDRAQLGKLINERTGIPKDELPNLRTYFRRYLGCGERFIVDKRHPLTLFVSSVNRWRVDEKTADERRVL